MLKKAQQLRFSSISQERHTLLNKLPHSTSLSQVEYVCYILILPEHQSSESPQCPRPRSTPAAGNACGKQSQSIVSDRAVQKAPCPLPKQAFLQASLKLLFLHLFAQPHPSGNRVSSRRSTRTSTGLTPRLSCKAAICFFSVTHSAAASSSSAAALAAASARTLCKHTLHQLESHSLEPSLARVLSQHPHPTLQFCQHLFSLSMATYHYMGKGEFVFFCLHLPQIQIIFLTSDILATFLHAQSFSCNLAAQGGRRAWVSAIISAVTASYSAPV